MTATVLPVTLEPDNAGQSAAQRVELRHQNDHGSTPSAWVDVEWRDGYIMVRVTRAKNDAEVHVSVPSGTVIV